VQALRAVVLHPLPRASAWLALTSAAQRVARSRGVKFEPEALTVAAELTERFGAGPMPGGAVSLLRAAASQRGDSRQAPSLGRDAVVGAFSAQTGYPRALIDSAVPMDPDAVLAQLQRRVVGQDDALRLLRDLVVTLKTAMGDPRKPLGSFLLLGPTGVGKTESALCLAEYLFGDSKRLVRFDMSEYADPGSAARLLGLYGSDGTLARRLREQPFGVILLDEIEKADRSVHDLLLQALGEGRVTDATGRTVNLRNAIVMMTSNLGAETATRTLGFTDHAPARSLDVHYRAAAAAFFRPEFLNRIDHVVPYHPLGADTVREIARRALDEALSREGLTRRNITVRYDDAVLRALADLGMDPRYGARPLKRAMERWVVAPIAAILAARGADAPTSLTLVARDGAITVQG
jgi:ATP-dependent Clp protease ATP-binding subunit ClpC